MPQTQDDGFLMKTHAPQANAVPDKRDTEHPYDQGHGQVSRQQQVVVQLKKGIAHCEIIEHNRNIEECNEHTYAVQLMST